MAQTRIESLHEQALQLDAPLAENYAINFSDATLGLMGRLSIDAPDTNTFMADRGATLRVLDHAFIDVKHPDAPEMLGKNAAVYNEAYVFPTPDGPRGFYPYMQLAVDPESIDLDRLNAIFRHELGHLLQKSGVPNYARPTLRNAIRTAGALTTVAGVGLDLVGAFEVGRNTNVVGAVAGLVLGAGMVFAGVKAMGDTNDILVKLNAGERDADAFAEQYPDFNPITLTA